MNAAHFNQDLPPSNCVLSLPVELLLPFTFCKIYHFHCHQYTDKLAFIIAGFFGDLLSLVCQSFSMADMVILLHGNAQPLSRIQPQLTNFFTEHFLQGQEPSDANIAVSTIERVPHFLFTT